MAVRVFSVAIASLTLAPFAVGQGFGNNWLEYSNQTATRLGVAPTAVSSNEVEIDFDYGDLDKNGFVDLVVARKDAYTVAGKRPNQLFMNENGVLQDRTALYASAADVPGDQGFLTPTNDRDVRVVDVTGDGWLDVVTSPVIGGGEPKHISHPRVYRNLGVNGSGQWLGLRFENSRIPQIKVGVSNSFPNGCSILAGDVTGDGRAELYIVDYDNGDAFGLDTEDRLLINDGNGYFTDETAARVSTAMTNSGFGTAGKIADFNGDGKNDIAKSMNGPTVLAYNHQTNTGTFTLVHNPYSSAVYNMDAADLNNDGRIDLVVSDDGFDAYLYNTGTDALGRAIWAPAKSYQFLSGGDDGFGGNVRVIDLDGDGWKDTLHSDVDVDIPGCNRRAHIYHNPGGAVGSSITLREERENSTSTAWLGAKGLKSNDLLGTYDSAVFDVDNDGDRDLVLGRCGGTYVHMNVSPPKCQTIAKPASMGDGHLSVCGQSLHGGNSAYLAITGGPAAGIAVVLVGTSSSTQPAFGGQVLVPFSFAVTLPLDATGGIKLPVNGGGVPAPVSLYLQAILAVPVPGIVTD
jgi:FG-GAP-like repeat